MTQPVRIIGNYISPYVRKVLVCLEIKGIAYQIDPIVPFYGNDEFGKLSPLRRVPVFIDDQVTLVDSTVICEYLEERYPSPALMPTGAARRARARWLEELADTRLGDLFVWRLFYKKVILPAVFGEKGNREEVARTLAEEIPAMLDYLEGELPADGFLFGAMSFADIALASFFRNAGFARFVVDPARWPKTAGFVDRTLASEPFQRLKLFEDRTVMTPIPEHRKVLAELGAPLTATSVGCDTPRRGVMPL